MKREKRRATKRRREKGFNLSPAPKALPDYIATADLGCPLFRPQLSRNLFYDDE